MEFFNRHHVHVCLFLLCLIISVPLACSSSHSLLRSPKELEYRHEYTTKRGAETVVAALSKSSSESRQLQQQQQRVVQEEDAYCSICQGLPILADKVPDPDVSPNTTCSDFDYLYRFSILPPTYGLTTNIPGTCRSDSGYNRISELCCKASVPKYECEQNIHEFLLGDDSSYNSAVPPIDSIDNPLNVSVSIIYNALQDVNVEAGTASIFLTIFMSWTDPRLAWNVADYDTCSNVIDVFTGHEVGKTFIWVPDFDLLNQIEGIQSLPDFKANVYSDGTVSWVMNGGIQAFCAFSGLANIPFDTLGCQLIFSQHSRGYSELVNYVFSMPDVITVGIFDMTYNEWTLIPELTNQGLFSNGDSAYYDIYFQRATKHYINSILLPTILLTYLSFFTYLLDLRIGERLGFGMALALVVVAQQIVTVNLTPVSNQKLWMERFVAYSFYWVLFGVVESVLIGFLFYFREDRKNKRESTEAEETRHIGEVAEERKALTDPQEDDALEKLQETPSSPSSLKDGFLQTFDLRKLDMLCLFIAIVSYATFLVGMFVSQKSGAWLTDEPRWYSEESTMIDSTIYVMKDPNN